MNYKLTANSLIGITIAMLIIVGGNWGEVGLTILCSAILYIATAICYCHNHKIKKRSQNQATSYKSSETIPKKVIFFLGILATLNLVSALQIFFGDTELLIFLKSKLLSWYKKGLFGLSVVYLILCILEYIPIESKRVTDLLKKLKDKLLS